jgi:uncharacterized protein (DUF2147 family)
MKKPAILLLPLFMITLSSFCFLFIQNADADKIAGTWLNQEGTAQIQVVKLESGAFAGKYYGKIVWLQTPEEDGKPKMDKNNPDAAKKTTPLMGLIILKDFKYDEGSKEWNGGTIYDPKNGKTYSCKINLKENKLNVRGYVGISLLGRTAVWTRVK